MQMRTGIALAAATALLIGLCTAAVWATMVWNVEVVAGGSTYFRASAMTLDANDQPHFAYFDLDADKVVYTTRVGGTWQSELVADAPTYNSISIAVDSLGRPHIAFKEAGTVEDLRYALRESTGWVVQTVESEGNVGAGCSIAIDGDDHPHIAYRDDTTAAVKYAQWTGTGWDISTVSTAGWADTSLALDGAGNPHILTGRYTYGARYYVRDGASWVTEVVDPAGKSYCKLVLDSSERPHAAYSARFEGTSGVKYAVRGATGWEVETIRTNYHDTFVTLALNSQDEPAIIYDYYNGTYPQTLTYVTRGGTGWVEEPIATFLENSYACLFFDAYDCPQVGWQDSNVRDVLFAAGHTPLAVRWPR